MNYNKILPFSPNDVQMRLAAVIPDEVIESFNELLMKYSDADVTVATFSEAEVMQLVVKKGLKRDVVELKGWLKVRPIFEKCGWTVTYPREGFNTDNEFIFTRKGA